jgi:hypothetical protein
MTSKNKMAFKRYVDKKNPVTDIFIEEDSDT